jgi:cell division protein FtsB
VRLALKVALCLLALAGALYLFVYPARTYLDQRHEISSTEHTLSLLNAEDSKLSAQVVKFHQASYIEQVARAEYGFVMPGQQAYSVLPETATGRGHAVPATKPGPSSWYAPLEFWHHL